MVKEKVENQSITTMQELTAVAIATFVFAIIAAPFVFIFWGAAHRAKQEKKVWDAADKYLNT